MNKTTKYAGTQTEKNLMAAFAGESEARNKYTYFASKAKKDGFEQIAALFLKTAENEKEHAKLWFKELEGIGSTAENLLSAAEGENYEWTDMYEGFASCVELAASTAYCFGIEADYFSVSYLRHAFKEAPVYFLCRSFRLVGVPKYDGKFGLLPESFPIIAYKRMYIHSLLFFTKDN